MERALVEGYRLLSTTTVTSFSELVIIRSEPTPHYQRDNTGGKMLNRMALITAWPNPTIGKCIELQIVSS